MQKEWRLFSKRGGKSEPHYSLLNLNVKMLTSRVEYCAAQPLHIHTQRCHIRFRRSREVLNPSAGFQNLLIGLSNVNRMNFRCCNL